MKGGLDFVIDGDDVKDGQDVEVDRQMEDCEQAVHEQALTSHHRHDAQGKHVGQKLRDPSPEGEVDVEAILLPPLLNDLRLQDVCRGRDVRVAHNVVEGQGVENHFGNSGRRNEKDPLGNDATGAQQKPEVKLVRAVALVRPVSLLLAHSDARCSSARTDRILTKSQNARKVFAKMLIQ